MASNQLLTISMITAESARVLGNNLALTKCINRNYDEEFAIKGAKIGQNVNVRKPARYSTRTGSVVDIQAQTETYAQLTFTNPIGIDLAFTSQELTFSLDMFSDRVIKPAVIAIANQVESLGFALVPQIYNAVGTPGTALTGGSTGTALPAVLSAMALLYDNDAPVDDGMIHEMNGSAFNAKLAQSNQLVFNPQKEISEIYVKGLQGAFGGAQHYMNQLVPVFTNGTYAGSPAVNGTNQSGGTLVTNGWTSGSLSFVGGEIFTIPGVKAVNPQTKQIQTHDQQFVVSAPVVDSSGAATLSISPAIVGPGSPFQNVSRLPTTGDTIAVLGGSGVATQNALLFHRDCIMLANQELVLPRGVEDASYVREEQSGVGIRVVSQFDIRTNQHITRFDTMVAWALLYPQLGIRIATT